MSDIIDKIDINEMEDKICSICNDIRTHETSTFVCSHKMCQECLVTWYKQCVSNHRESHCPICRKVDNIWGK